MRNRQRLTDINFDSLTDILTCSVGIMFVIVILSVMNAGGAQIKISLPKAKDPAKDTSRLILLCQDGTVRPWFVSTWLNHFYSVTDNEKITYHNLPKVIDLVNEQRVSDKYFDYRFEMIQRNLSGGRASREVQIIINPLSTEGYSAEDIKQDPQRFLADLQDYPPEKHWISLWIDPKSIQVFRDTRALLADRGYATGWEPLELTYPFKETILGGGSSSTSGKSPTFGQKTQ